MGNYQEHWVAEGENILTKSLLNNDWEVPKKMTSVQPSAHISQINQ